MIRQFLDTACAHVSRETHGWLSEQAAANCYCPSEVRWHVAEHNDGWWCRVPDDSAPPDFPPDLLLVCDRARTLGAEYILFDHDAEPIPDLPIYDR